MKNEEFFVILQKFSDDEEVFDCFFRGGIADVLLYGEQDWTDRWDRHRLCGRLD